MTQVELIREAQTSSVFRQGKDGILKIVSSKLPIRQALSDWTRYHHRERTYAHSKDREIDSYPCKGRAYCRLKALGLWEKAYFLDYSGLIKDIDPIPRAGRQISTLLLRTPSVQMVLS